MPDVLKVMFRLVFWTDLEDDYDEKNVVTDFTRTEQEF